MFVYRLSDIRAKLDELEADGFEYVDVSEIPPDDGDVPFLSFEGISSENSSVDYDGVDAVILPEGYYFDY